MSTNLSPRRGVHRATPVMRAIGGVGALVLVTAAAGERGAGAASPAGAKPDSSIAFTDVTVVDVRGGRLVPDQTVLVTGTRIHAVGKAASVRIPQGTRVVDARGKYLIPGLWDMHIHVWNYPDVFYPLLIANGVTGVRQMSEPGDGLDSLLKWRQEIRSGARVGPRIVGTGGTIFSSPHPGEIAVQTADEGRRVVDSLKAAGADFVKFHEDDMARDVYFAIAAEARRIGFPLVGHLPNTIDEIEASDSGQQTVEHFNEVHCWWPANAWPPSTFPPPDSAGIERCREVARAFARNGTWFTPTLTASRLQFGQRPDRQRYWSASIRAEAEALVASGWGQADPTFERGLEVIRLLHQAGMPLLAGTDAAPVLAQIVPGFSLHDELGFLADAGLAPLEALRTATLNPAQALRATDSLGTVEPGKLADLVLLDADPLTSIHNTTAIRAVVANGRYYDRATLDALLAGVERAAKAAP